MNALFVALLCLLAAGGTSAAAAQRAGAASICSIALSGNGVAMPAVNSGSCGCAVSQSSAGIGAPESAPGAPGCTSKVLNTYLASFTSHVQVVQTLQQAPPSSRSCGLAERWFGGSILDVGGPAMHWHMPDAHGIGNDQVIYVALSL